MKWHSLLSRFLHSLYRLNSQGVVTYMSPVEAFGTRSSFLIGKKCVWLVPSEALDCLISLFFMYCSLQYVMFTSYNDVLYVMYYYNAMLDSSVVHRNHQQCLVAEWLGLRVTVRGRIRARECIFSLLFFFG